jgi:hypothetical protein
MAIQEMQNQALQLSIGDHWRLAQSLWGSIQRETSSLDSPKLNANLVPNLDPWTQSLIDVVQLDLDYPSEPT